MDSLPSTYTLMAAKCRPTKNKPCKKLHKPLIIKVNRAKPPVSYPTHSPLIISKNRIGSHNVSEYGTVCSNTSTTDHFEPLKAKTSPLGAIFARHIMTICHSINQYNNEVKKMQWEKPKYTNLRLGFEVTMYFAVR